MVNIHRTVELTKLKPLIVLLIWCFSSLSLATEIQVTVDRNPVSISDSFQLTFSAKETPDDDPDFTPLKRHFDILNQQQSSQSSWVNGSFSKTIQWTLNVMAKRTGRLSVPAIRFGNDITRPLTVTVTQAAAISNSDDELFLQVEASPEQPYVQSQVVYTLRFYRRVQITQASLSEPEPDNAVVEKLTEDSNYNTTLNGVTYAVTERKYAIFPQQSGPLLIAPLVLTAQVVSDSQSRFNGFFNSQVTKTKRVTSRTVTLNVLPAPNTVNGEHWLPAEQVYLEQKWSNQDFQVKVGEPLTRTLTIMAKGSTVSQLPELEIAHDIANLKSYPDQPVLKEQKGAEGLIALREEKIAFIPSAPGTYQLPAIEIPWFNTQTKQKELARIPAVSLIAIGVSSPVKTPAQSMTPEPALKPQAEAVLQPLTADNVWMWLSIFLGTGWLLTLLFILGHRFRKPAVEQPVDSQQNPLQETSKTLKIACRENDLQAAKQALLQWGKFQFKATSLGAIAPFCEARLRDEILHLNHCLYAAKTSAWDGKRLFKAFAEHNARKQIRKPVTDALEPLFRV